MTQINLSESMRAQLGSLSEPVVFCDESGKLLGEFTPMSAMSEQRRIMLSLPEHLRDGDVPIEELRRRLREGKFIPHEEVVRQVNELLKGLS